MRIALPIAALCAAVLAGCATDSDTTATPSASSEAVVASPSSSAAESATAANTAPTPASAVRGQACRDILPLLDQLRAIDPATATSTAETTIDNLPATPEWPSLSEADRAATIAGIRDAAAGSCR